MPYKELQGRELESFFKNRIVEFQEEYVKFLSQFEANDLFHKWREFIRHIDELYNIGSLTTPEEDSLITNCSIDICNDPSFKEVVEVVGKRYGVKVQERFITSSLMLSSLNMSYALHGQYWNCCQTLGDAIDRCQAMRRYYVTMLMLIPQYAKGNKKVEFIDLLNFFQPMIDMCLVNMRTAYNALMVNECIEDFKATPCQIGLKFNYDFNHLGGEHLEPVRMSHVDVLNHIAAEENAKLHRGVHQLYGFEELEDGIALTSAVYGKYDLDRMAEYQEMTGLTKDLKLFLRDDYAFVIPEDEFMKLQEKYSHLNLCCNSSDFEEMLNSCPAFFKFEHTYYSTVLLYQRFMVNEEYRLLNKKKRFQIVSGFVFEKNVKQVLREFDYEIKDIKRINHKEFDVICAKEGCIYNFQCKNNEICVAEQGSSWLKKSVSTIKRLNKTYEIALAKEDGREELLKQKLGMDTVESYLVSRYPVITRNARVINYERLREWLFKREFGIDD